MRIGRAHIGDDLDALGGADRQHRAHPLFQQRIVAAVGIFHPRLLRQRDGALAEAFEHQIVDVALLGEFDRGLDAVAGIAGAGSYSNGSHGLIVIACVAAEPSADSLAYKHARHAPEWPCVRWPVDAGVSMSHQERNNASRPGREYRPWPSRSARDRNRRRKPSISGMARRPANCACSAATPAPTSISRRARSARPAPRARSACSRPAARPRSTATSSITARVPGFTPPYAIAVVELDEGPRMMTQHRRLPADAGGARTRHEAGSEFEKLDDKITLPLFRPAKG